MELSYNSPINENEFYYWSGALSERAIEIVELDRHLANDEDGQVLRQLSNRLLAGKDRVHQEMNRGVSTDEYARLTALSQAYDSGLDALPKIWASINQNPQE